LPRCGERPVDFSSFWNWKEQTVAHKDPQRHDSERHQRRHVGNISEASDIGIQGKSQGKSGTAAQERKSDDLSRAPAGDKAAVPRRG
jgi:hypothetical protein